ncbi:class I SAM-dependent methyltransferase [Gammaproteobacteria bacterium]|nr:class I SAM-dependent methyltransferase [Gammaproteobacteria bacterium]
MNAINNCEVCGNTSLIEVLDLGKHPMCDDLVEVGDARVCKEYPIEILYCNVCRTGHQKFQVPKEELFPSSYHYRSRFTADVLSGMSGLVDSCEEKFGDLDKKVILDIGCNDGSLLDFFKEKGSITLGIEPTDAYKDADLKGHEVYSDYLSVELAEDILKTHGHPSIITFTNVFAHIEDLDGVLASLKVLQDKDTKIVIENHYLGAVLDGNQFDTFYHEHPRTYSYTSFKFMAKTLGINLEAVEFPSRYGGNIRVFMGLNSKMDNQPTLDDLDKKESLFEEQFKELKSNIDKWIISKDSIIKSLLEQNGKINAKAFPGRSAILVKMLNIDESVISAVYEKPGSLKIDHYVPGTRIPILSDDDLLASDDLDKPLLNLAWHISSEIHGYLKSSGFIGPIVDILDLDDFR